MVLAVPRPAKADTAPDYPIEVFCHSLAGVGGHYSQVVYGACLKQQKSAKQTVIQRWAQLPAGVRDFCSRVATVGGPGDYALLANCIAKKTAPDTGQAPSSGGHS